jgi:hypothetical protein
VREASCPSRRMTRNARGNEYLLRLVTPFAKGTRLPGASLSQARDSAVVAELVDAQR